MRRIIFSSLLSCFLLVSSASAEEIEVCLSSFIGGLTSKISIGTDQLQFQIEGEKGEEQLLEVSHEGVTLALVTFQQEKDVNLFVRELIIVDSVQISSNDFRTEIFKRVLSFIAVTYESHKMFFSHDLNLEEDEISIIENLGFNHLGLNESGENFVFENIYIQKLEETYNKSLGFFWLNYPYIVPLVTLKNSGNIYLIVKELEKRSGKQGVNEFFFEIAKVIGFSPKNLLSFRESFGTEIFYPDLNFFSNEKTNLIFDRIIPLATHLLNYFLSSPDDSSEVVEKYTAKLKNFLGYEILDEHLDLFGKGRILDLKRLKNNLLEWFPFLVEETDWTFFDTSSIRSFIKRELPFPEKISISPIVLFELPDLERSFLIGMIKKNLIKLNVVNAMREQEELERKIYKLSSLGVEGRDLYIFLDALLSGTSTVGMLDGKFYESLVATSKELFRYQDDRFGFYFDRESNRLVRVLYSNLNFHDSIEEKRDYLYYQLFGTGRNLFKEWAVKKLLLSLSMDQLSTLRASFYPKNLEEVREQGNFKARVEKIIRNLANSCSSKRTDFFFSNLAIRYVERFETVLTHVFGEEYFEYEGEKLTAESEEKVLALIEASLLGQAEGFDSFSKEEVHAKTEILKAVGFSDEEIKILFDFWLLGI